MLDFMKYFKFFIFMHKITENIIMLYMLINSTQIVFKKNY